MSVVIRFTRAGTKKKPIFHLVVANEDKPRDGKYLERVGIYFPKLKDKTKRANFNHESIDAWVKKGARLTETVGQVLKSTAKS